MINIKTLSRLAIITVLVAVPMVAMFMHSSNTAKKFKNTLLYPDAKVFTTATQVQLKTQQETLTLVKINDKWGIAERNNYPVQPEKVQEILQSLATLKIIEPKTTNSILYDQLDLADLKNESSKAYQIIVQNEQQQELANLLVGKREAFQDGANYLERIFIRKTGEQQAWLVQGLLALNMNISDWLAQPLLGVISGGDIKTLTLAKPDLSKIIIAKSTVEQEDFSLQDAPVKAGMKLDLDAVNTVPFEVAELQFVDILPAKDIPLDWSQGIAAQVETFAGVGLDLMVLRAADNVYAKIQAKAPQDATVELQQQVADINNKTQGWYYKLTPELYNTLNLAALDFLQIEEPVVGQEIEQG